jgi:hypothetical protein
MHSIQCRTLFDITQTDVRHQFNQSQMPFHDTAGHLITNHREWMLARNQQRKTIGGSLNLLWKIFLV